MTGAGELDRRIVIERDGATGRNAFGEREPDFQPLTTLWAKREDVSDTEKVNAGQKSAARMCRFKVRSNAKTRTVTAADRIAYGGETWNILGAKETKDGRRRFIELTAVTRSD